MYYSEIINKVLIPNVGRIITGINSLSKSTESEFIFHGTNLQNFSSQSKAILKAAEESIELLSNKDIEDGIASLDTILTKINHHIEHISEFIEKGSELLDKISKTVEETAEIIKDFDKIVHRLRMLSISTKIESQRLGDIGSGFTFIAENIEKLSVIIDNKAESIKKNSSGLIRVVKGQISYLEGLKEKQKVQFTLITEGVQQSKNELLKEYKRVENDSKILPEEAMHISASIGEIVSSLQFHDITRQQIEHVAEALEEMAGGISDISMGKNEDEIPDKLINASDICEIQKAQLEHSKDQINIAVEKIIENLRSISLSVQSLYANIIRIASDSKKGDKSFIAVIKRDLLTLVDNLKKNKEIAVELTRSIKEVADTVSVLGKYVEEINETGDEIELIALNARVKAAHTGTSGAVLDVLAEAIQRLSGDSKELIDDISTKLKTVGETSAILKNNSEKIFVLEEGSFMEETSEEIKQIIDNLSLIDNRIWESFNIIGKKVDELKINITKEVGSIIVHKKLNTEISDYMDLLQSVIKEIGRFAESEGIQSSKMTDHLHRLYSMESERKVHKIVSDRKSKELSAFGTGSKIRINSREREKQIKKEEDFGDNVELF